MHHREDKTRLFLFIFIFLASALCACVDADRAAPVVHTKLGSLRGVHLNVKGKETEVHAYLAVPFAKPPVGPALRLAPPQPVEGWEGVRDATEQPSMCVQNEEVMNQLLEKIDAMHITLSGISEDCLYLNIYTPANRAPGAKLPVMVWIHGGGFVLGSASMFDGSALAAYQDVVVVSIQYRLGVLGFLSTGDEHMTGNFGLLDQVQALRWIQEHIHSFGGDADWVTIFGESAGGVSVSLLLLSPLADGLFHRAIAESGTAAMDLLVFDNPLPMLQVVANASGCSLESTEAMASCLKITDYDTIVSLTENVELTININIDGLFLTTPVDELYRKHEFLTVPFMTGVNDDEGGWLLANYFTPPGWTEGLDREHVFNAMSMFYKSDVTKTNFVLDAYIGTGEDRLKNRKGFTEFLGDVLFNIPALKTANAHRDAGAPVFLYQYQHAPEFLKAKRPSFVGSDHSDEIFTVFGFCFTASNVTLAGLCSEEEQLLSRKMMSYWANFARTGSPNGNGLAHWPRYEAEEKYLAIGLKEQVTGQHLKKERFIYMTQTLQEQIQQHEEKAERSEL